jgi:hypothetical protein
MTRPDRSWPASLKRGRGHFYLSVSKLTRSVAEPLLAGSGPRYNGSRWGQIRPNKRNPRGKPYKGLESHGPAGLSAADIQKRTAPEDDEVLRVRTVDEKDTP